MNDKTICLLLGITMKELDESRKKRGDYNPLDEILNIFNKDKNEQQS